MFIKINLLNPEGTVGSPDNTKVLDLGFWLLHKKKNQGVWNIKNALK